jgi:hypothetical protein
MTTPPKKVFISYAHESSDYSDLVLELSNSLRAQGIDAEIDQYEEAPPEGWPKWMTKQIQNADYVLVCCSESFEERARDTSGANVGLGAKWETTLIFQELYGLAANNTKFIPVFLGSENQQYVPLALQPYTHYDVSDSVAKQCLIDRINGTAKSKRPVLGKPGVPVATPQALPPKSRRTLFVSSIIDIDLWNKAKWAGMGFVFTRDHSNAPLVCFLFRDGQAGNKIFRGLKDRFGKGDDEGEVRLSFIENPSSEGPGAYKVHFGSSREVLGKRFGIEGENTLLCMISRIHQMNPAPESKNLESFRREYEVHGHCYITNAVQTADGGITPTWENVLGIQNVHFRQEKEVIADKNDEDIVVFCPDGNAL